MSRSVSVVVPIGRWDERAVVQAEALVDQESDAAWQLVLSCNTAEALAGAERWRPPEGRQAEVVVVDATATRGPSFARNVGMRAAGGEVILFCDADDVVAPLWLRRMAALAHDYDIFGGGMEYASLNPPGSERWNHPWSSGPPTKFGYAPFFPSCNIGMRRWVIEAVGDWDQSLPACEDTDYCWRAQRAGASIGFDPEALIRYRLRESPSDAFRQHYSYGRSDALLMVRYRGPGVQRSVLDGFAEVFKAPAWLALSLLPSWRLRAAAKLGNLLGRIVGSIRWRVWVV